MHRYIIDSPLTDNSAWRKFFDETYDEFLSTNNPNKFDKSWVNRVSEFIDKVLWERHGAILKPPTFTDKSTSMVLEFKSESHMTFFILRYA